MYLATYYEKSLSFSTENILCQKMTLSFGRDWEVDSGTVPVIPGRMATLSMVYFRNNRFTVIFSHPQNNSWYLESIDIFKRRPTFCNIDSRENKYTKWRTVRKKHWNMSITRVRTCLYYWLGNIWIPLL